MLAERNGIAVDEAFAILRANARSRRTELVDLAADVLSDRQSGHLMTVPSRRLLG